MSKLDELIELKEQYDSIARKTGLIDIGIDRIHLSPEGFLGFFSDYETKERGQGSFPFKLLSKHEGITFFALASAKEMREIEENKPDVVEIYSDEDGDDLI